MTPAFAAKIEKALAEVCETQFACGEWDKDNESDEGYEEVFDRSEKALARLRKMLRLDENKHPCSECAGRGRFPESYNLGTETCLACGGTGRADAPRI